MKNKTKIYFPFIIGILLSLLSVNTGFAQKNQTQDLAIVNKTLFVVEGMNSAAAEANVVNAINDFPDKIKSWQVDLTNSTILVTYANDKKPVDIMELIYLSGYKIWYINDAGMKVVLIGTNQTEEQYIKP